MAQTLADYPQLFRDWHPTRNGTLGPQDVSPGSGRRCWWQCSVADDHVWEATAHNRVGGGRGCPMCAGQRASSTNSLAALFPDLAAQFDTELNAPLRAEDLPAGSAKRCWWRCPVAEDHVWQTSVSIRTRQNTGCPACAGKQPSVSNSLSSLFPEVAAEWDSAANAPAVPSEVTYGTQRKAWWRCSAMGHSWRASVLSRTRGGNGCPFCSNQRVCPENSLAALFPRLASQLAPDLDGGPAAEHTLAGSGQKRPWRCPVAEDHVWRSTVDARTRGGHGCPACAGKQPSVSNSLASLFPAVAAQFALDLNRNTAPQKVPSGSHKKYWWRCANGHAWSASVASRTAMGSGCPHCALHRTSAQEVRLAFEVAFVLPAARTGVLVTEIGGRALRPDIVLPQRVAVEFDGSFWHRGKEHRDRARDERMRRADWSVVRVREAPLRPIGPLDIVVPFNAGAKEVAGVLLVHLRDVVGLRVPGLDAYLSARGPQNARAADAYLAARRSRRAHA